MASPTASPTRSARRLMLAGGFAVAASAAPILLTLAAPAGPIAPVLAQCPPNEVLDQASGACKPVTDKTGTTFNPVDPGISGLQPGGITSAQAGDVGQLPEVNGIPCQGDNTGLCIGLEQNNAAKSHVPHITTGATG